MKREDKKERGKSLEGAEKVRGTKEKNLYGRARWNSMRSRMILCLICLLLFISAMLLYFTINLTKVNHDQTIYTFQQISKEMERQLEGKLAVVEKTAKSCGYFSMIQKAMFSGSPNEKLNAIVAAREVLSNYRNTYPYIKDIFIYVSTYTKLYTNTTYITEYRSNMRYYGLDTDTNLQSPFLSDIINNEKQFPYFFYYMPIRNILRYSSNTTVGDSAVCAVLCDFSDLISMSEEQKRMGMICALLYDGNIVSCSAQMDEKLSALLLSAAGQPVEIEYQGEEYYLNYQTSEKFGDFVCIVPKSGIAPNYRQTKQFLYLLAAIGSSVTMFLLFLTGNRFSLSLNSVLNDLREIRGKSGATRVKEPEMAEMQLLAREINELLEQLETSMKEEKSSRERLLTAAVAQREAEMIAYRSQINPHFLFNTMECMRSMAQYYHVEPIEEIVSSTAKLFRYSLYAPDRVPFRDEIEHAEQFLKIISYRYSVEYALGKQITGQAADCIVPSMILQPLVENCVKHGFQKDICEREPRLLLQAKVEDGFLKVSLTDNGCGMGEDVIALIEQEMRGTVTEDTQEKDSIGIHNIYKRLILFNENNTMQVFSKKGYYTQIRLRISIAADNFRDSGQNAS